MKKILSTLLVTIILVTGITTAVFAANETQPQWHKDMMKWKRDRITQLVKDGEITTEQGKICNERLDEREKWHEENGYDSFARGNGCGYGKGHGYGRGHGRGHGNYNK